MALISGLDANYSNRADRWRDASLNNGMNAGLGYQTSVGQDIQDHAFRLRFGAEF